MLGGYDRPINSCVAASTLGANIYRAEPHEYSLGRYIVDHQGYTLGFFVTAVIQGLAVAIWVLLLYLVPKKEARAYEAALGRTARSEDGSSTKEGDPTTDVLFHVEELDRTPAKGGERGLSRGE